jgi:DNA repair exonuclease SbcCD ATPase subunit
METSTQNYNLQDKQQFIAKFEKEIEGLVKMNDYYDELKNKYGDILKVSNDYIIQSLEGINNKIGSFVTKFNELKSNIEQLKNQIKTKDDIIKQNNETIQNLNNEKTQMNDVIQQLKQQETILKTQIDQLKQENTSLQSEISNLKGTFDQQKQAIEALKKQLFDIQQENAKKIVDLTKERDLCNKELQGLVKHFKELTDEITGLKSSNKKIEDENNSLIQRIINATTAIEKASGYLTTLMKSTNNSSSVRSLVSNIENSIQTISNSINGSNVRSFGGKKIYKKTKQSRKKLKHKKQKGGFLYRTTSNRKSLNSIMSLKKSRRSSKRSSRRSY